MIPRTFFVALLGLSACGTSSPTPGTGADAAADRGRDAAPEIVDDDVPPCSVRPDAAGVTCVRQVRGRAVDFDGAPLARHVITYCGPACFSATTDSNGAFTVEVNDFVAARDYTLQVHGRPDHASAWFAGLDPVGEVVTYATPLAVPRYQNVGAELPMDTRGGAFTAGDVTVTIPMGAQVEFDVEDFELGALGRTLRATRVDLARAPAFAREAGLAAVWALAPFNAISNQPMAVRLANTARLAPNAAVEFVVMGNEIAKTPITASRPVVVGRGTVSADGMSVSTAPGVGVRYLTWIGVRLAR